ncbi:MAG: hypothetical protein ACI9VR_002339 [Cognaticolwellia sp.]|jgi:hypothetical protein
MLSPIQLTRTAVLLLLASFTILLGSCAASKPGVQPSWLPDSTGWEIRKVHAGEPLDWVIYERDALVADVKEFRIVGVVDAPPKDVVRALRFRLLDDQYIPEGVQREILTESKTEIVIYGLMSLPFPLNDREATERTTFSHDPVTGVFRVDIREVDPGDEPAGGVLRIPVVRNVFVIAPTGSGKSVVTNDSVHDIGGHFPNRLIYSPVCDQLILDLLTLRELSDSNELHVSE